MLKVSGRLLPINPSAVVLMLGVSGLAVIRVKLYWRWMDAEIKVGGQSLRKSHKLCSQDKILDAPVRPQPARGPGGLRIPEKQPVSGASWVVVGQWETISETSEEWRYSCFKEQLNFLPWEKHVFLIFLCLMFLQGLPTGTTEPK